MDSTLKEQRFLKKNLKLLQKKHPALVLQLEMTDPSDLIFCWTQEEELNLKRLYENQTYYYHSPIDAQKEAQEWFQSLNLHFATVIFVYGLGLGYYYEAAKHWLDQYPRHNLVFLEEDLAVLYRFCETELCTRLLKNRQVKIVHFRSGMADKSIFNDLSWTYFESPFAFSALKLYQQVNSEGYLQLHHRLTYHLTEKKIFVGEYMQYGIAFFRNFYPNLLQIPYAYSGNALFNRFSQIPAIICGAGPSLDKNIDSLPSLKEKALLFAGGSALNALIPKGVIPHFGVAIDPNKDQYSRVIVTQPYHIPFFYRNRLFHEALAAIKGPRLYLTGAGGYETAHWFEKQLNIEGEDLDEGHNVVNFSVQIAQALGCNPIILVGVDLAFTHQQYYANGIAANLNLTQEDLKKGGALDLEPVLKEDIHGKPIYTLWKWVAEAEWIAEFALSHPEITIINATEGGLGFKGIANLSLQEVAQQYLNSSKEEIKHIETEIQKHSFSHISPERILELLQEMKSSLDQCIILLSRLIEQGDVLAKQIANEKSFSSDLHRPEIALLESDLEHQVGYQFLLNMFDKVYIHSHHREFQELQEKHPLSTKKRILHQLELKKQRLVFLRDVSLCNRELICHAIK